MIGAIVGDIAGSRFEFDNHKLETLHSFELKFQCNYERNYRKLGACPKGNCRGYVRWVELG